MLDPRSAILLSDFFLDIAKAFFIATFVTPSLSGAKSAFEIFLILFKGLTNVIIFLVISRQLLEFDDKYE